MRKYSEIPDDQQGIVSPSADDFAASKWIAVMDDQDVENWILYLQSPRATLTAYSIPEFLAMAQEVQRLRKDRAGLIRAMRSAAEWLKAWG
jgi:hypothetical protein